MQFLEPNSTPQVVAEIGQNHQGDTYHALRLMEMAANAGANYLKLQARDRLQEFSREDRSRPYTGRNSFGKTYGDHRARLDLDDESFAHLKARHQYNENPAELFTTVCAVSRIEWLEKNNWCRFYKLASKDMNNHRLIDALAETGKPLIISTGQAENLFQIEKAYSRAAKKTRVVLLHCVSEYPLPIERCNLSRIETLRTEFGCPVGYSDHSAGVKAPVVAAIKYNACLVEVHVTMSRAQPGTDHAASLEQPGLAAVCQWIREAQEMVRRPELTVLEQIAATF